MLDFLGNFVFYTGLAVITGIVYLEFRNIIQTDFTHGTYYPLGLRPIDFERFIQWMIGADKSDMEADFRRGVNDDDDDDDTDDDDREDSDDDDDTDDDVFEEEKKNGY